MADDDRTSVRSARTGAFSHPDSVPAGVYAPGHYGVSLLAYVPVGGGLLSAGHPNLALAGGAIVLWLAMLPDVDHRLPLVEHRGVTHTVPFALGVGGVLGGVAYAAAPLLPFLESPSLAAAFVGAMGAYGVLAHLLGDVLTPAGIPLLWPLSGRTYSLSLWTAKNPIANYLLLVLGAFATAIAAAGVSAT